MSKTYPEREQRHHSDIFAGLTFYFMPDPNAGTVNFNRLMDEQREEVDITVPWTVVGKEYVTKLSGGYWRYLLLGPGPSLVWYEGRLGWIKRVADPVWEERDRNGWGTTLSRV